MSDRKFFEDNKSFIDRVEITAYKSGHGKDSFLRYDKEYCIFLVNEKDVQAIRNGERSLANKAYIVRRTSQTTLKGKGARGSQLSEIIKIVVDASPSIEPTKTPLHRYF